MWRNFDTKQKSNNLDCAIVFEFVFVVFPPNSVRNALKCSLLLLLHFEWQFGSQSRSKLATTMQQKCIKISIVSFIDFCFHF